MAFELILLARCCMGPLMNKCWSDCVSPRANYQAQRVSKDMSMFDRIEGQINEAEELLEQMGRVDLAIAIRFRLERSNCITMDQQWSPEMQELSSLI